MIISNWVAEKAMNISSRGRLTMIYITTIATRATKSKFNISSRTLFFSFFKSGLLINISTMAIATCSRRYTHMFIMEIPKL